MILGRIAEKVENNEGKDFSRVCSFAIGKIKIVLSHLNLLSMIFWCIYLFQNIMAKYWKEGTQTKLNFKIFYD